MEIKEMVVVITGGAGDTATEVINQLKNKTKHLIVTLRNTNKQLELKNNILYVKGDLYSKKDVEKIHQNIIKEFGTIHAWINIVGGFTMGNVIEDANKTWDEMINVNFLTTLNCCEVILPTFKKNKFGRLINFGSQVGNTGMPLAGPYCVSKSMVHMLTKLISQEVSDDITCNAIVPGVIDTPKARKSMPNANFSEWSKSTDLAKSVINILNSEINGELIEI